MNTLKQEVGDDISVCTLNILHKVSSLPSLLAINLVKVEIWIVQWVTWPHVVHLTTELYLGASYTESNHWPVWCPYIFCCWRYVFYFSRDLTRLLNWSFMHICWWELLALCHHTEKFGDHSHSSDGLEEKCFIENMNLINMNCQWKNWVDWLTTKR